MADQRKRTREDNAEEFHVIPKSYNSETLIGFKLIKFNFILFNISNIADLECRP